MEQTNNKLQIVESSKFQVIIDSVRDDIKDNPYLKEAVKVLEVGGYRSAIGSIWNAVVDDLRKKVIYRSLELFNKEMNLAKKVNKYEDFQDNVTDEVLIDGAYKIGVIGWEAHKILKHVKDTRHIFDGHPQSSEPTAIKTLSMMEDCVKYVLSQEYSPKIIDIDDYISLMDSENFDRTEIGINSALDDLPEIYKSKLANMLFSKYLCEDCSNELKANIELVSPILWRLLNKDVVKQIANRVDNEISDGDKVKINQAFAFIKIVNGNRFLSTFARKYLLTPVIEKLNNNLDNFEVENDCVEFLYQYSGFIPKDLIYQYVNGLTQTYVGKVGFSYSFARTDFYADIAAMRIPAMFEKFDSESIGCFVDVIKNNLTLKSRIIKNRTKFNRLKTLANVLNGIMQESDPNFQFIKLLITESDEEEFFKYISV